MATQTIDPITGQIVWTKMVNGKQVPITTGQGDTLGQPMQLPETQSPTVIAPPATTIPKVYNAQGYDAQGFNRAGVDANGYNIEGVKPEAGTDWGMDGYGGVALGAGQLGLGVMSYLENQKTADKQRQVMDQQIENNTFALGTARKKQAAMNRDFGRRPVGM